MSRLYFKIATYLFMLASLVVGTLMAFSFIDLSSKESLGILILFAAMFLMIQPEPQDLEVKTSDPAN